MKKIWSKVQSVICTFLILISCSFLQIEKTYAATSPPASVTFSEGETVDANGVTVKFVYGFYLKSYDRKTGTAEYTVSSWYRLDGYTKVMSDLLYVNGAYIGTFQSGNGWKQAGVYSRSETFRVTLHEGMNKITTKGESGGVGGDSNGYINIDKFSYYTVRFQDFDGSHLKTQEVEAGQCASPPANPTRYGYRFTGWDKNTCNITQDTTITAQYTPWKHEVRYDANGGTNAPASQIKTYGSILTLSKQKPVRNGYTFLYWNLKQFQEHYAAGGQYGRDQDGGTVTLSAVWINEKPQLIIPSEDPSPPSSSEIPPFIQGNTVIVQKGDTIDPLDHVRAQDKEDGDLTNKVKIIKDPIPRDDKQKTTTAGIYEVQVSVRDAGGQTTTGKVIVQVNDPPTLEAKDRWYYVEESITMEDLLSSTKAKDKEDGDLSTKIQIKSHNIQEGVIGTYWITYEVRDSMKKSVTETKQVHIVDPEVEENKGVSYLRFIQKQYYETLHEKSVWRIAEKKQLLQNTLFHPVIKQQWYITPEDIVKIKAFNETHGYSKADNEQFYEEFQYLIR